MTKRIEWKVPQEPLTAVLEVRITGGPLAIPPNDATIDDLRKACEAVGLVVMDRPTFDDGVATNATLRAQLADRDRRYDALEHQLAALSSTEGRATDEELERIYALAANGPTPEPAYGPPTKEERRGALAVAARVRREPGLVERLVAEKVAFNVWDELNATWSVRVVAPRLCTGGHYTTTATDVPAADVPATLARLAGLDGGR